MMIFNVFLQDVKVSEYEDYNPVVAKHFISGRQWLLLVN